MKCAGLVLTTFAIGACNTPTPRLRLAFAGPPSQACPSTNCAEVPMICETVMSIRIADPADTTAPYLSQCSLVDHQRKNMCALAVVDLEPTPLPVRELEVQVALYPATAIPTDPMNPGALLCPAKVAYSAATGFPVEQAPTPALGGHAFYHPGDEAVVVTLGCTDLAAINDSCVASDRVTVTATIEDFNTRFPVTGGSQGLADRLLVSVGEPRALDSTFVLNFPDIRWLARSSDQLPPTWGGDVDYLFNKYACLEVFEMTGQSTATVRCKRVPSRAGLELSGVWMGKPQLDEILLALGTTEFPNAGLTVGMVIDDVGNPVAGAIVSASTGTVAYPAPQGDGLVTGGTSTTGIFLSSDAVFGAEFSTGGPGQPTISGIGGLVAGRATIVILQTSGPQTSGRTL